MAGSDLRIPNLFVQTSVPENSHHHAKAITASIARFICKDMRPYSVVENREMINTLEPKYKITSIVFSVKNVSWNCIGIVGQSKTYCLFFPQKL